MVEVVEVWRPEGSEAGGLENGMEEEGGET